MADPSYEILQKKLAAMRRESEKLLAAEGAIQRQNEYLTALNQTALALLDKLDRKELLQTILERAAALAGARHGYIFLRRPDAEQMDIQVGMGLFSNQLGLTVRKGEGLSGRVWQTGQPMLVDNYQVWPDRLTDAGLKPIHSVVVIPLKRDKSVRGVIGLGHIAEDKRFDQESIMILERFAALALLSLQKAELYAEIKKELAERKKAQLALRNYQDQLEASVLARTAQLASEVEMRRQTEVALRHQETELKAQSQHLEEVNTALKVLLKQREEDKMELQESVLGNVKELVAPYLQQIRKTQLTTRQKTLVQIIESNLDNIVSPFINRLSHKFANFTPTEIRVANLVKEGRTNKEIGDLMSISKNTVLYHRHNIRKKLKLTNTAVNMRSYLLTFDE